MGNKTISFQTAGNHWYWRSHNKQDCQTGTIVTLPEKAKITGVSLKVAGLDYNDPVYGYQYHKGRVRPAIWDYSSRKVISSGAYTVLPISAGGSQSWVHFDLTDVWVEKGQTSSYATQWDYNTSDAGGWVTLADDLYGSNSGPFNFSVTDTYSNRSLNFVLEYQSGGKLKTFQPSSGGWVTAKDVRVWDGNSWDSAVVRVWDGASWQESNA